jgi:hypothetical protein
VWEVATTMPVVNCNEKTTAPVTAIYTNVFMVSVINGNLARKNTRNNLPAVAAIDSEIGIGGEKDGVGECFRHAHQTGIRETHGYIGKFLNEDEHSLQIVSLNVTKRSVTRTG